MPEKPTLWVATTVDDGSQAWIKIGGVKAIGLDVKPLTLDIEPVMDALRARVHGTVTFQGSMSLSPLGVRPSTRTMSWPSLRAMGPGFSVSDKLGYDLGDGE